MNLINFLTNYIFGLLIGCFDMHSDGRNVIICSSIGDLKNIKEISNASEVMISGRFKQRYQLNKLNVNSLYNVTRLHLYYVFDGIENGTLQSLENLKVFDSDGNYIPVIKADYFDNPKMTSIIFRNSHINEIEAGAFLKLPMIRYGRFMGNNIQIIKKEAFENTNFYDLTLEDNKIEVIENGAFFGMKNLESISLENNFLKTFDSNKIIGKSLSLEDLVIAYNFITEITKDMTSPLPNLTRFNASKNFIETIESRSFQDLERLAVVDLSRNKIEELKPDLFNKNNNLTQLFLHGNQLTYISDEFLINLPNLNRITIIGNPWQCTCQSVLKHKLGKNNCEDLKDADYKRHSEKSQEDFEKYKKLSDNCYYMLYLNAQYL